MSSWVLASLTTYQVLFEISELKQLQKKIGAMRLPGRSKNLASIIYNRTLYSALFHRCNVLVDMNAIGVALWIRDKKCGLYNAASKDSSTEVVCLKCEEPSEDIYELKVCGHRFCGACLEGNIVRDIEDDDEASVLFIKIT